MARIQTIAELRKELQEKEAVLDRLKSRRQKLQKDLAAVDAQITRLSTGGKRRKKAAPKKAAPKRKLAKKAAPKRKAAVGPRGRRAKDGTLADYITKALAKAPEGLRAKDIDAAVRAAGYPTRSKDLYGQVATTLSDKGRFTKIRRGVYKLK